MIWLYVSLGLAWLIVAVSLGIICGVRQARYCARRRGTAEDPCAPLFVAVCGGLAWTPWLLCWLVYRACKALNDRFEAAASTPTDQAKLTKLERELLDNPSNV